MNFTAETDNGGIRPVLLNYGGAPKPLQEMNEEELETARQAIMRRAKDKAFSKGLPVYYVVEGTLVAEYADGRTMQVME